MTNAGAHVAGSAPSRSGSIIEDFRPLQLLTSTIDAQRVALANCGIVGFALSPLNVLPKLALEKWTAEQRGETIWLTSGDGIVRVLPLSTTTDYYQSILQALEAKKTVALVPDHIAQHLKKSGFNVEKQQVEYLMKTSTIIDPPGPHHQRLRNYLKRARQRTVVEEYSPDMLADYLALNKSWYAQNKDLKFRTYDKTSIDWLLQNWPEVKAAIPDAKLIGIRVGLQLIAFDMGCLLAKGWWTSYTHRFDRTADVQKATFHAYAELAKQFIDVENENQGTADNKAIRDWKSKMAYATQTLYMVKP